MKKLLSYVLILLLMSLISIGCGKTSQPAQAEPSSSTQNSKTDTSSGKTPANSDNLGAKLSTVYADMMKNNKYLMKYKMTSNFEGESIEIEATVATSGDNMAVTSIAKGIKTTIISKGNKTYMVDHSEKMVIEIPQGSAQKNAKENEIETDGLTYVSSGAEDGLNYEKYSTTNGVIKYYFDGKKLVKIAVEIEGQTSVMNILEMSNNVSDSMFEIPSDYQKTPLPN